MKFSAILGVLCFLACVSSLQATPAALIQASNKTGPAILHPTALWRGNSAAALYLEITYLDKGYGKIQVQLSRGSSITKPDRFLDLYRMDTGRMVTARMRIPPGPAGDLSVRVGMEHKEDGLLLIHDALLDDQPFADPQFSYVISSPWLGPYTGPSVRPADNTTLKGKVMVGYQGWFRTPNDPDGRGWVHWGDIQHGLFTTDMWPDVTQYPAAVLEKAADVKTRSGRTGYLFSSDWPEVTDIHFRWMREHDIDGAFVQRFVSDNFASMKGGPEWVLSNVRASANHEGRIWAIEYDVSGCPDARLLATLEKDWAWMVDTFGLLKDPNYAREGGKPVVFIWGMPFPDRNISLGTANAVVDFFKNDPKYGGDYVIGGIPGNWRKMDPSWQEHFKRYDAALPWMSQNYAEDLSDFRKMGLTYYAHVKPGFSWANLKHLPTGDTSAYTPREGGLTYWNSLSKAARAGVDRLFVGMFDEYDESTAIMPMSDDPPPTPVRPGVAATFYNGFGAREQGIFERLPGPALALGGNPPAKGIAPQNFFARLGGQITFSTPGTYTFSIKGAAGDDATLFVNNTKVLAAKNFTGITADTLPITAAASSPLPFRLEYRHATADGALQFMWESPGMPPEPVPPDMVRDAWGRFLTNEGRPSDWWLTLTTLGKEMMNGKLSPATPMPQPR